MKKGENILVCCLFLPILLQISFSSVYKILMPFTRDFESIKNALNLVEEGDKTSIDVGLVGAAQHILEEWGNGTPCQVTEGLFACASHTSCYDFLLLL